MASVHRTISSHTFIVNQTIKKRESEFIILTVRQHKRVHSQFLRANFQPYSLKQLTNLSMLVPKNYVKCVEQEKKVKRKKFNFIFNKNGVFFVLVYGRNCSGVEYIWLWFARRAHTRAPSLCQTQSNFKAIYMFYRIFHWTTSIWFASRISTPNGTDAQKPTRREM